MTIGLDELPEPATSSGRTSAEGQAATSRTRASGRVQLGSNARLSLASVRLADIRGPHPVLQARDVRLDLAGGGLIDFTCWTRENLDIVLSASPMWCVERGHAEDRHFLVVCGGHLLPALRQALPSTTRITVILVDARLSDRRWLQIAAVHTAAIAACASDISDTFVQAILNDAESTGMPVFKDRNSNRSGDLAASQPAAKRQAS